MYNDRTLHIINTHDTSKPLFLYNAWQEAHTPNEVPDKFLGPDPEAGGIDWPLRRTYEGMLHALDSALGNVTAALKAKQMWDKTIIVFSSAPADALLNDAPCPPCASHGASINRTPESFPALAAPLSRLSAGCSRCPQLTTILTHLLPPIGLSSRPQVTTVGERTGSSAVTSKHRRLKLNCPLLSACWVILCYRIFTICVGSVLVSLYVA
jgi:hypothetical protein